MFYTHVLVYRNIMKSEEFGVFCFGVLRAYVCFTFVKEGGAWPSG